MEAAAVPRKLGSVPDPLKWFQEVIVIVVVLIVFAFLWRYRDRVLLALTGDSHLHGGPLDCLWWIVRCGGSCTGDWTRNISIYCCPCLPSKYKGRNLVKELGRLVGFASKNVEIRNLVVGDLPYGKQRGDFFICVQCANNPDQVTSVAEDKEPKVVHFPETLTLRLRESALEGSLKIVVKEVNVLGFQDICEVHISAEHVIEWRNCSQHGDRVKRFEMKPLDTEFETETQPWILIEFGMPTEPRELDNLRATPDTVRTLNADNTIENSTIVDFKNKYELLDSGGNVIQEPFEGDLKDIHYLRECLVWAVQTCNCTVVLVLIIYSCFRFYLYSCYMQYTTLTMAILEQKSFPMSTVALQELKDNCFKQMDGTGLAEGSSPCRPTKAQIHTTCHHLPPNQPPPGAGKVVMREYFGIDIDGAPCSSDRKKKLQLQAPIPSPMNVTPSSFLSPFNVSSPPRLLQGNATNVTNPEAVFMNWVAGQMHMDPTETGVCEIRDKIQPWDTAIWGFAILLILSTCCAKWAGNQCIKARKAAKQKQRAELTKDMTKQLLTQTKR